MDRTNLPSTSKRRSTWTELEVDFMLNIMRDKKIMQLLDGKRFSNLQIFKIVEEELKKRGFLKSAEQIRVKWKPLKQNYYKLKRSNNTSGRNRQECSHWDLLDELLAERPLGTASTSYGIESQDVSHTQEVPEEVPNGAECDDTSASETSNDTSTLDNGLVQSSAEEGASTSADTSEMVTPTSAIRKKRTPISRAYTSSMKATLTEWKQIQESIQTKYMEQQKQIISTEMENQRQWEEKIMKEERQANETFMTGLMNKFFINMQTLGGQCTVPFYNPMVLPYNCTPHAPSATTELTEDDENKENTC